MVICLLKLYFDSILYVQKEDSSPETMERHREYWKQNNYNYVNFRSLLAEVALLRMDIPTAEYAYVGHVFFYRSSLRVAMISFSGENVRLWRTTILQEDCRYSGAIIWFSLIL